MRFSALKILTEGLSGNKGWTPHWRNPDPKPEYDAVIIGGGGHGLSSAYYMAKNHGFTNIAVLEKGWLGGGNVGRNTTIVRANYFLPGNKAPCHKPESRVCGRADRFDKAPAVSRRRACSR